MHENRYFVVPVNILTQVARAPDFLGVYLDIYSNQALQFTSNEGLQQLTCADFVFASNYPDIVSYTNSRHSSPKLKFWKLYVQKIK